MDFLSLTQCFFNRFPTEGKLSVVKLENLAASKQAGIRGRIPF
jgi:hypothetical protein